MHPRTAEKQGFGGIRVENSEQNLNYGAEFRVGRIPLSPPFFNSILSHVLNMNVRSRDRDCAVERSPGLESIHQLFRVRVRHAT
jgi:hypothetical protein